MPINSLEFATRFTGELDKAFLQKSVTGFMADNNMGAKFVGAKTVKIPDVDFVGLADYDRDTGFSKGAVTVANKAYELTKDRARTLQIDREDMDETGVSNLAGQIMGEYVRTKVIPECDAYVLSKIAGIAKTRAQYITGDITKPYEGFSSLVSSVRDVCGYDEELVCFIDSNCYAAFQKSTEISKMITVSEFKQGDISLKVKSIDGINLLPVTTSRMKSAYTFDAGATTGAGGFAPTNSALGIYMIVLPKRAAHLVKKTEKVRVFTPEQNQTADAYKFDYRIYYDVFVKGSELASVWASFAPSVTISSDVSSTSSKTAGSISGSLSVTAAASDSSTLAYQWFKATDANKSGATPVSGATAASWTIDTALTAGTYYYFVRITAGKSTVKDSAVCTLTVS